VFPESPRWHDGRLWFSDMLDFKVISMDSRNRVDVVTELDDEPSGLGFMPDGTLLVVSMHRRQVVRVNRGRASIHADLHTIPAGWLNDMVVDGLGRAYVDCIARPATWLSDDVRQRLGLTPARLEDKNQVAHDCLVLVQPDGSFGIATADVTEPNGLAITPDGRGLIYATLSRHRLTRLRVEADGSLNDPEVFAELGSAGPDGICLDAQGAVWIGGLESRQFLRVLPGGHIADSISVEDRWAIACVLGGDDRRTLFMTTARNQVSADIAPWMGHGQDSKGFIEAAEVQVPGAGWP